MGWITRLPGMGEWGRLVAYRAVQLKRLPGIELTTGRELDADEIRGWGADVVVLATGSSWAGDGLNGFTRAPIPGADDALPHVLTPEQVLLEGKRPPGPRVVVYDGDGYFAAAGLAELLAGEGHEVELVTGYDTVAPFAAETLEDVLTRSRLHEAGVAMRRATTLAGIEPGRRGRRERVRRAVQIAADAVVLVTQRVSRDRLYHELDGTLPRVHRIGDCVAPRILAEVVFDGHRLAREIDQPDPEVALPYLRERPMQDPPPAPAAAAADADAAGAGAAAAAPGGAARGSGRRGGGADRRAGAGARRGGGGGRARRGRRPGAVPAAGRSATAGALPCRGRRWRRRGQPGRIWSAQAPRRSRRTSTWRSASRARSRIWWGWPRAARWLRSTPTDPRRIFDHADFGALVDAEQVAAADLRQAPFRVTH